MEPLLKNSLIDKTTLDVWEKEINTFMGFPYFHSETENLIFSDDIKMGGFYSTHKYADACSTKIDQGFFLRDWDHLMMIVDKIESIRDNDYGWFLVTIQSNTCSIQSEHFYRSFAGEKQPDGSDYLAYHSDFEAIANTKFLSCLWIIADFCKWYNSK